MQKVNKIKYELFSSYNFIALSLCIMTIMGGYHLYDNFELIKHGGYSFYAWLNVQSPFLAGAIGLWILGVFTFLIRDVPKRIWSVIVKQSTVTLTLNNVDEVYDNFRNHFDDKDEKIWFLEDLIFELKDELEDIKND